MTKKRKSFLATYLLQTRSCARLCLVLVCHTPVPSQVIARLGDFPRPMEAQKYERATLALAGCTEGERVWQTLTRLNKGGCLLMDAHVLKTKMYCLFAKQSQNTGKNTLEKISHTGETSMRTATLSIALVFGLFSSISNAADWPDSCVGNFCMFKPPTEKQFVERYGKGALRSPFRNNDLHYRCFYDEKTHQWAEFQFSRHGNREPRHLEGVTLGLAELCSTHNRGLRQMNLKIAKGTVAIGMNAKEVAKKLGPPSKIVTLKPNAPSELYDSQFGEYAWIYESLENELLFTAIYIKDGKMVNYRLLNSE